MGKTCANCGKRGIPETAATCPDCGFGEWEEAARPALKAPPDAPRAEAPSEWTRPEPQGIPGVAGDEAGIAESAVKDPREARSGEPAQKVVAIQGDGSTIQQNSGRPAAEPQGDGGKVVAAQGDHSSIVQGEGPGPSEAHGGGSASQKVTAAQGDGSSIVQGTGNVVHHGDVTINIVVDSQGGFSVPPWVRELLKRQAPVLGVGGLLGRTAPEPADEPMAALDRLSRADPAKPQLMFTSGRGLAAWRLGVGEGPTPYMTTERSIGTLGWRTGEGGKAQLLLGYRYGFYELDVATCGLRDRALPDGYNRGRSFGFSGVAPLPARGGFLSSHRQFGIWRFPSGDGAPHQVLECGSVDDPDAGPCALHLDWDGSLCFACGPEYRIAPPPFSEVTHSLKGDGSRIRGAAVIRQERMRVAVTGDGAILGWHEDSVMADSRNAGQYMGLCVVDMADDTVIFAGRPEAIDVLALDLTVLKTITGVAQMRRPKTMRVIPPYLVVIDDTTAHYSTVFVFDLRTWKPMEVTGRLAVVRTSLPVFDALLLPSEVM